MLRLKSIDFRLIPVLLLLMLLSLIVISTSSQEVGLSETVFWTPLTISQLKWFGLGSLLFLFTASLDYNKLREWVYLLYPLTILLLIGLFFVPSIQNVHRWYRLFGFSFQPSEFTKLTLVMSLSLFLERRKMRSQEISTLLLGGALVLIPFILILKQPDLGTALVLLPITLVMFYFGDLVPNFVRWASFAFAGALLLIALLFTGILPHETIRPFATKILKEYQFDRLSPKNHHQNAAATAIAIGGILGKGMNNNDYTHLGFLPAPTTDSVFPAFTEQFGLLGVILLLGLYYSLIYFSFQVTASAKDTFGRLLAAGLSIYLAMHILINVGMMCSFLPITGVPLILMTYGGSSVLATMLALGLLQSIYSRRFTF